jgi:hypothetical protein
MFISFLIGMIQYINKMALFYGHYNPLEREASIFFQRAIFLFIPVEAHRKSISNSCAVCQLIGNAVRLENVQDEGHTREGGVPMGIAGFFINSIFCGLHYQVIFAIIKV